MAPRYAPASSGSTTSASSSGSLRRPKHPPTLTVPSSAAAPSSSSPTCCSCCELFLLRCPALARALRCIDPRRHLAMRLSLAVLFLVILYVIILTLSINRVATELVKKQTGQAYADVAFQTARVLDRVMFERWREAQTLAALPQIYDNNLSDDTLLNRVKATYSDYAWIGITNSRGIVVAATGSSSRTQLLKGFNVTARPWYGGARQGPFVGDVHLAVLLASLLDPRNDNEPYRFVDIACPLYKPVACANRTDATTGAATILPATNCTQSQFNGILGLHLSWDWAKNIRSQALQTARVDAGVDLLILNKDGMVLLGPPGMTNRSTSLAGLPSVARALSGVAGSSYDEFPDDTGEGGWFLTGSAQTTGYDSYPGLGWIVLVRQSRTRALAPAHFLETIILAVVLVVGAILTVCTGAFIHVALRPLSNMASTADGITEQLVARKHVRGSGGVQHMQLSPLPPGIGASSSTAAASVSAATGTGNTLLVSSGGSTSPAHSLAPIHVSLPISASIVRQDEVGHLALSLESLLGVLNSHRLELQGANARLEVRVQARTAELEAVNRELEMFSQTVSHDLRAPLGSILASAQLLGSDLSAAFSPVGSGEAERAGVERGKVPPSVGEYLGQIGKDVRTMTGLIADLLELSRINHSQLRIKSVDLAAMARQLVADLQRNDPQRVPHVTVLLPQASPSSSSSGGAPSSPSSSSADRFVAQCDEGLARVVLTNLLSNAWKYSGKRAHAVIEFGCVCVGGSGGVEDGPNAAGIPSRRDRVFYVRDNGAGFNMAHARKLFQPFVRMHKQTEFSGVGVGLSTVSRCCQRHGGRIWARSKLNEGAAFFFTLAPEGAEEGSLLGGGLRGGGGGGEDGGSGSGSSLQQSVELPPLPSGEEMAKRAAAMKTPSSHVRSILASSNVIPSPSIVAADTPAALVGAAGAASPATSSASDPPPHFLSRAPSLLDGGGEEVPLDHVVFHEMTADDDPGAASSNSNNVLSFGSALPQVFSPLVQPALAVGEESMGLMLPLGPLPVAAVSSSTPAFTDMVSARDAASPTGDATRVALPMSAASSSRPAMSIALTPLTILDSAATTSLSSSGGGGGGGGAGGAGGGGRDESNVSSSASSPVAPGAARRRPGRRGPNGSVDFGSNGGSGSLSASSSSSASVTKVLFVDDSFINCKLGSRILTSNGMQVDTAADGIEVLALLYPSYKHRGAGASALGAAATTTSGSALASDPASPAAHSDAMTLQGYPAGDLPPRALTPSGNDSDHSGAVSPVDDGESESGVSGVRSGAGPGAGGRVTHVSDGFGGGGGGGGHHGGNMLSPGFDGPAANRRLASPMNSVALARRYDVILMDLNMPEMDGLTCVSVLRHLRYPGRVVALTAHDENDKRDECLRAGFDGYCSKPFSQAQLLAVVAQHKGLPSTWQG